MHTSPVPVHVISCECSITFTKSKGFYKNNRHTDVHKDQILLPKEIKWLNKMSVGFRCLYTNNLRLVIEIISTYFFFSLSCLFACCLQAARLWLLSTRSLRTTRSRNSPQTIYATWNPPYLMLFTCMITKFLYKNEMNHINELVFLKCN